jgi:DNA-binding transcriptional ArsR family regulator
MAIRHQVLNPPTTYVAVGEEEPLKIGRFIVRDRDRKFIKLFPNFTESILVAMRSKKLKGSADTLLFFLNKLMDVRINGSPDQIAIIAPAEKIAHETGKSVRAVREHIAILLELGFIEQPRRGIPDYVVPPNHAYRGVLKKLYKKETWEQKEAMAKALREMRAKRAAGKKSEPKSQC